MELLIYLVLQSNFARIAQLVEHDLAKVGVAGSNPVSRSLSNRSSFGRILSMGPGGGIGRHAGLKILWPLRPCRFDPGPGYIFSFL